jgi:hypothetical protein
MFKLRCLSLLFALALVGWAARPSFAAAPIPPSNLNRPNYDYSDPDSCTACHFIDGFDHMPRAVGVQWNDAAQRWERTGHGWWDSRHAQSQYGWSQPNSKWWKQPGATYGSNDNTFCTYCHSPLQANGKGSVFNGAVINGSPIPKFQGVTCSACHPGGAVTSAIAKQYPTAVLSGRLAILIRGQDPSLVSSWIPILAGQEDQLCLSCHEQDPHDAQTNAVFGVMYDAGVTCFDCHMGPYRIFTGTAAIPEPPLTERFHDWRVAENLPYSCGVQGAMPQFSCHPQFNVDSTRAFIPLLTMQHSEWWSLPPFSGGATSSSLVSAHSLTTPADYMAVWQQIQAAQQQGP